MIGCNPRSPKPASESYSTCCFIDEVHHRFNLLAPRGVSRNVVNCRELIEHFNACPTLSSCVYLSTPTGSPFSRRSTTIPATRGSLAGCIDEPAREGAG